MRTASQSEEVRGQIIVVPNSKVVQNQAAASYLQAVTLWLPKGFTYMILELLSAYANRHWNPPIKMKAYLQISGREVE